jgi:hypothetical protein
MKGEVAANFVALIQSNSCDELLERGAKPFTTVKAISYCWGGSKTCGCVAQKRGQATVVLTRPHQTGLSDARTPDRRSSG